MGITYLHASKCPMCGGDVKYQARECEYCGSTLIVIGVEESTSKRLDIHKLDSAMIKWADILKKDPDNIEANYALGLIYLNKKLRNQAVQYLRKASMLAPGIAVIHYNLAIALFNDGNVLLNSQDYRDAIREIDYAVKGDPGLSEALGFKHFFVARNLQDTDSKKAIEAYKAAIAADPKIPTFYNNLGLCYMAIKDYYNAEYWYRKTLELDPAHKSVYTNLCSLCFRTGNNKDGVIYGRKAVELLSPSVVPTTRANAYNNLALCLWKTGQKDEAIQNMKKAISLFPNTPLYKENLQTITGAGCGTLLVISIFIILIFLMIWFV